MDYKVIELSSDDFANLVTPTPAQRIQSLLGSNDVETIMKILSNNRNIQSIKVFSDITGIKLSNTRKIRMPQLREFFGIMQWIIEQEVR